MRGKLSIEEIKKMDNYAQSKGVELIPCIQTLAHLNNIFRYANYAEIKDFADVLLVGDQKTYDLIDNMFASISEAFSSRKINIGMDEAFALGRGKYLDKFGQKERSEIMKEHLKRVLEIANKYSFECKMWSDMFMISAYGGFYERTKDDSSKVKENVPKDVSLIYWDYYHVDENFYSDSIIKQLKLSKKIAFAGGVWTWLGFCPNNSFTLKSMEAGVKACLSQGVKEAFFTLWGDDGGECSYFSALPSLVAISEYAKGNFDLNSIKKCFYNLVKIDFDAFCLLEKPDKVYSTEEVDTFNHQK